jgi:hypothetical protein
MVANSVLIGALISMPGAKMGCGAFMTGLLL